MYQDYEFVVEEVAGAIVERLGYLVVGPKPEPHADILFIRPTGRAWQRAFLDVGGAVWEDWGETGHLPSEVEEDAECRFIDCSDEFHGATIARVRAISVKGRTSRLVVEFEQLGTIVLSYVDETDWESDTAITRERQSS